MQCPALHRACCMRMHDCCQYSQCIFAACACGVGLSGARVRAWASAARGIARSLDRHTSLGMSIRLFLKLTFPMDVPK
jgi:hypothetical protein